MPRREDISNAVSASRVETVRALIEAVNDRRLDDDLIERHHVPDVEVIDFPEIPGRRLYRGHDGVREFLSDLSDNWKSARANVEEIREVGDNLVVLATLTATGAMTDVPVESDFAEVFEFDGDLVARVRMFRDRDDALEAAADA